MVAALHPGKHVGRRAHFFPCTAEDFSDGGQGAKNTLGPATERGGTGLADLRVDGGRMQQLL